MSDAHPLVHVQEQSAVGLIRHPREELPLGHRRGSERDVGARVFQDDGAFEKVLDDADPLDDMPERSLIERHRKEVVRVSAGHTRPAEVIGDPSRPGALRERLQLAEVLEIERVRAADRQRHTVHHDRVEIRDDTDRDAVGAGPSGRRTWTEWSASIGLR